MMKDAKFIFENLGYHYGLFNNRTTAMFSMEPETMAEASGPT